MPEETRTPVERWLAVLRREKPDRIPMDYWATGEATRKVMDHLGCGTQEELLARLHVDRPVVVGPRYVGPTPPAGEDIFGCRSRPVDYGTGVYSECVYNPLAQYDSVEGIEANYTWPDPDWWDYSEVPQQLVGNEDKPIQGGGSEPFLVYKNLRGQERAFMDLIEYPDIVHYSLDKLFELAYQNTLRIYEAIPGKVHISYVAEDLGAQDSLMYSPGQIREFLLPRMRRMMDLVHSAGAYVFHHTDGAARDILPDLVEAGIDVLQALQFSADDMDPAVMKQRYGDRLCFQGGVSVQTTLPFGTADDVRAEARRLMAEVGRGGGFLLGPAHDVPKDVPLANVLALIETCREQGGSS